MKLVHPDWEKQILFGTGKVPVISIEEPKYLYDTFCEIYEASQLGTGAFVLSDQGKIWDLKKRLVVIGSPVDMNPNDRKLLTKLFLQLKTAAYEETHMEDTRRICGGLLTYFSHLAAESEADIAYDMDIDLTELCKALHVHIDIEGLTLPEKMLTFMKTWVTLCGDTCFCFNQFRNFLPLESRSLFYRNAMAEGLHFFLLEGPCCDIISEEDMFIIDKDLCQIF